MPDNGARAVEEPTRADDHSLPTPTLIYDADCGFCTVSARWIERHFTHDAAVIRSWQSTPLLEIGLTEADVTAAAWWVGPHGVRERGHLAIAAALLCCGRPWSWAGRIIDMRLVAPIARRVYAVVAGNRHLLPGGTDTCRL